MSIKEEFCSRVIVGYIVCGKVNVISLLLPNESHWLANSAVSFQFIADAFNFIGEQSSLKEYLRFCMDAEVDTLDMQRSSHGELTEMLNVVESMIKRYEKFDVLSDFQTMYLEKLFDLQRKLRDVQSDPNG